MCSLFEQEWGHLSWSALLWYLGLRLDLGPTHWLLLFLGLWSWTGVPVYPESQLVESKWWDFWVSIIMWVNLPNICSFRYTGVDVSIYPSFHLHICYIGLFIWRLLTYTESDWTMFSLQAIVPTSNVTVTLPMGQVITLVYTVVSRPDQTMWYKVQRFTKKAIILYNKHALKTMQVIVCIVNGESILGRKKGSSRDNSFSS